MKEKKITHMEQRIAANILTAFMFTKTMDDVSRIWDEIFEEYQLHLDPFTYTPCSTKEYINGIKERAIQTLHAQYGHADGLED